MWIESDVFCFECEFDVWIDEDGCCVFCGSIMTGRSVDTPAHHLAKLEKVAEAARDALTIHEDVACSCRGCQRIHTALATFDEKEVGGD